MASIERLQISGIRSFSPVLTDHQSITFHRPLTVILGKNGAGKTTIIEALLNATTGEMPPGSSGAERSSFVYDPKAAGENEVKGQIRLVFTARDGRPMQVIRSFQVTQTKTKTTFATLDSALSLKNDATGKVERGTYRSADVDRLVPEMLGVSRAVLEHVVFCHQEDCNWPLGAPSEVKRRFDDIFAASRYVSALDQLREVGKQQRSQQKDNEAMLITLREHKEQARGIEKEASEKEEAARLIQLRNREIEPRLQQLTHAVQSLDGALHAAEALAQDIHLAKGRIDEKERVLKLAIASSQTHQSSSSMSGGIDGLRKALGDCNAGLQRLHGGHAQREAQLQAAETERRRVDLEACDARATVEFLDMRERDHTKQVDDMRATVRSITPEFVVGDGAIDDAAIVAIEDRLSKAVSEAKQRAAGTTSQCAATVSTATDARDLLLRTLDAEGKERDLKQQQVERLGDRVKELTTVVEVTQRECPDSSHVGQLEAAVASLSARRAEELARQGDVGRDNEMAQTMKDLDDANAKVATLQAEAARHHDWEDARVRHEHLKHSLEDRRRDARRQRDAVVQALAAQGIRSSEDSATSSTVSQMLARKRQACAFAEDQLRKSDRELAALQHDVNQRHAEVERLSQAFSRHRGNVNAVLRTVCAKAVADAVAGSGGTVDDMKFVDLFDSELQTMEQAAKVSLQAAATAAALGGCHDGFAHEAQTQGHCPVCKRRFSTTAERESFIRAQSSPRSETEAQAAARRASDNLHLLKAQFQGASECRRLHDTIVSYREAIRQTESELDPRRAAVQDNSTKWTELKAQAEALATALQLAQRADEGAESLAQAERAFADAQRQAKVAQEQSAAVVTSGSGGPTTAVNRPVDVIQRDIADAQSTASALNRKLLALRNREATSATATLSIEVELEQTRARLATARTVANKVQVVTGELQAVRKEIADHVARIQSLSNRRVQLQSDLQKAQTDLSAAKEAATRAEAQANEALHTVQRRLQELVTVTRGVKQYITDRVAAKAVNARQQLKTLEAAIQRLDADCRAHRDSIRDARAQVDDLQKQRAALVELERVESLKLDIDRDRAAHAQLVAKLDGMRAERLGPEIEALLGAATGDPAQSFLRTRERLRAKMSELEQQRAQNVGSLEMLNRDVADRRATLAKDKYRDIDKRYLSTFVRVQTTELAIQDIDRYHRALEKAVSSYHQEKITQVNNIIADLWRATYRGSDIDTIEIRSEDEHLASAVGTGGAFGGGAVARRSYKYRVVMKRGTTELDMRMRCSAGQKVLASVVIRMALSEAFCCDCGILALDEPTTNLDDDNARSLAEALRDLIDSRQSVRNFQLIVITHDEQFVRALGSHRADSYYFVSKDKQGVFSQITERRFADLLAS